MEQESSQELSDAQSHEPLLVAVRGIAPSEGDVAVGECYQPGVRDGDAMGVCAEVAQHMLRSAEGPFGIDNPVVAEQHAQPGCEGAWLCEVRQAAVELEFALVEGVAKSFDELAAEDAAEHADGKEEGAAGGDPAGVIRREAAGGNDAVDVRMKLQALIPAVEHAEEADLGAEMPGIAGDFQQGLGARVKEQVVDQPLVL